MDSGRSRQGITSVEGGPHEVFGTEQARGPAMREATYNLLNGEKFTVEYDETEIIRNDITTKESNTWLVYFIGAIGIIAFISLITFKNRKLQVLLSGFNFLFILGFVVMMYMYTIHMKYFDDGESRFSFFVSLPLALIFLNFFAIRRVKKDEQLIRSMDRLR